MQKLPEVKRQVMRLETVVYIDVLFAINFVGNFMILWVTSRILRLGTKEGWLALGAGVGALYAVFIFFPSFRVVYTVLAKFLFSMLLVALTYRIRGAKLYIKALAVFYLVTFVFGGSALSLFYFTGAGMRMGAVVRNGVLYFEMPWKLLMIAFFITYPLIRLFSGVVSGRMGREKTYFTVRVERGEKTAVLCALLDTGNHLRDPLTDAPVMVTEYRQVQEILPREFCSAYEKEEGKKEEHRWDDVLTSSPELHLRLIPFRSLGKENGMLIGFKPDRIFVEENEREMPLSGVVVGLCRSPLSGDAKYSALLAPEMML